MSAPRWRRLFGLFGNGIEATNPPPKLRVTQIVPEPIEQDDNTNSRVSQVAPEAVAQGNLSGIRTTQIVVEVIKTFTCATPPGGGGGPGPGGNPTGSPCIPCCPAPSVLHECEMEVSSVARDCEDFSSVAIDCPTSSEIEEDCPTSKLVSIDCPTSSNLKCP